MELLSIIAIVFVLIFLVGVIVLLGLWEWSMMVTKAPFIGISHGALPGIIDALKITTDARVYDLGCGDGRVLFAAEKRYSEARYTGFDKAVFPLLLARVLRWRRGSSVEFVRGDFFQRDLSDSTHLFTYLFPALMNDLLPKLERELRPGTRLVSCDFKFAQKEPKEIIELPPHRGLGSTLYIYEF